MFISYPAYIDLMINARPILLFHTLEFIRYPRVGRCVKIGYYQSSICIKSFEFGEKSVMGRLESQKWPPKSE